MEISCSLLLLIAAVCQARLEEWNVFKQTYGKVYNSSAEEELRMNIFHQNKQFIEEHNKKFEQGLVSYSLGMNHFGDLMNHEFRARMNGYKRSNERRARTPFTGLDDSDVPDSVDWVAKGAVTPVKNQYLCGSCWAFSTTGSLEGRHFLKTGELVSLSEQQLVDCSWKYGNLGCFGGLMDNAFKYIKDKGGLDTEASYKYWGLILWCRSNQKNIGANITGYVDVPAGDEDALKSAVAEGPVSVAIDASSMHFQFYSSGVYNQTSCSTTSLDHGVVAVGYGNEGGQDYWLVKNSWGTSWGEKGYIKMSRNNNNQCGIASQAVYPTV